jgi:hypothetical protein
MNPLRLLYCNATRCCVAGGAGLHRRNDGFRPWRIEQLWDRGQPQCRHDTGEPRRAGVAATVAELDAGARPSRMGECGFCFGLG